MVMHKKTPTLALRFLVRDSLWTPLFAKAFFLACAFHLFFLFLFTIKTFPLPTSVITPSPVLVDAPEIIKSSPADAQTLASDSTSIPFKLPPSSSPHFLWHVRSQTNKHKLTFSTPETQPKNFSSAFEQIEFLPPPSVTSIPTASFLKLEVVLLGDLESWKIQNLTFTEQLKKCALEYENSLSPFLFRVQIDAKTGLVITTELEEGADAPAPLILEVKHVLSQLRLQKKQETLKHIVNGFVELRFAYGSSLNNQGDVTP